jgi:Flp pilus assembly protein TadG
MHSPRAIATRKRLALLLNDVQGAAILEFAISLPLLVVFVVGIYDFSGAFNQKQKIEQAAQEGAILAGSQPMTDIGSNPESLQAAVVAVFNSLASGGVLPNAGTGSCKMPPPAPSPAGGTALTWTYTISGCTSVTGNNLLVTFNRGWASSTATPPLAAVGTQVTIIFPYVWKFNGVIQFLVPGATYAGTTQLTETAVVHNQM